MIQDAFTIKLSSFEGPFDLLLFFIERDELDIYDVPIARITEDFIAYIHQLESLNIDVASDFILFTATLMRIKSKMLLPRPELNEDGEEVDPREELVKRLLEYKKYKSVLPYFQHREDQELKKTGRGNIDDELLWLAGRVNVEAELQHVDMSSLMRTFERMLKRHADSKKEVTHDIVQYPYTIEEQKESILLALTLHGRVSFVDLLDGVHTYVLLVFNFMAILEMITTRKITVQVGEGYNNFWITKLDSHS